MSASSGIGPAEVFLGRTSRSMIESFVNMRDRNECVKRKKLFRDWWSAAPATMSQSEAIEYGVVALRLDPAIVANQLGAWVNHGDIPAISEEAFAIARDPSKWKYWPDQGVPEAAVGDVMQPSDPAPPRPKRKYTKRTNARIKAKLTPIPDDGSNRTIRFLEARKRQLDLDMKAIDATIRHLRAARP